jgi:ferredoxin
VGLIAGYHALQAGISVVGLVEALPECGGYKVHKDKLVRMGVPIYTSHTILSANGTEGVESVTIAAVDESFHPIAGTEKSFACDTVLIAVGLDPVNEFYLKAREFGMPAYVAGDAEEIAEASAAIFSGRIRGLEIARSLGAEVGEVPQEWLRTSSILKSKPGKVVGEAVPDEMYGVVPVIHCSQEIPCNPCAAICPHGLIDISGRDIRSVPTFLGDNYCCEYCERCVVGCPGLAITVVNYRYAMDRALVTLPYEFWRGQVKRNDWVTGLDTEGGELGSFEVQSVETISESDRTILVRIEAPRAVAGQIAGIRIQNPVVTEPMVQYVAHVEDDVIMCRCERVTVGEIRRLIRAGYRDINEIKIVSRAGMGACGSKTCNSLLYRIFREEGIPEAEIVPATRRPLFIEVPLGVFAGIEPGNGSAESTPQGQEAPARQPHGGNGSHDAA